jgi:hypothetical protein
MEDLEMETNGQNESVQDNLESGEQIEETLSDTEGQESQDAQGALTSVDEPSRYRDLGCNTTDVNIDDITRFTMIPDYSLPTDASRPIVVRTPAGHFCIDGWDLIEEAKAQDLSTITVDLEEMGAHSDEELCIRKAAVRTKTRGGEATYAEIFRNTRDVLQKLLSTDENLRVFDHGGRRHGEGFNDNKEEDALHLLSKRLGKERNTVNTLLVHCEYLSGDAIGTFIEDRVTKDFFNKARGKKRQLINMLKGEGKDQLEITNKVSIFMLEELKLYKEAKEARKQERTKPEEATPSSSDEAPATSPEEDAGQPQNGLLEPGGREDNPSSGDDMDEDSFQEDEPVDAQKIRRVVKHSSARLSTSVSETTPLDELEESIKGQLDILTNALKYITVLKNESRSD